VKKVSSNKILTAGKVISSTKSSRSRSKEVAVRNGRVRGKAKKLRESDDIQYVLPLGNGWIIKDSKSATFIAITDSKTEAISIARNIAMTKHTQLIVHGKNGAVEIRENYV
jgi:NAD(P)H-flavin reductase